MTPKITSKPIIDGIKTFHGLKLLLGGGSSLGIGTTAAGTTCGISSGGAIGRVTLLRTKVSSSASSMNCSGGEMGRCEPEETPTGSIPAAMVKSSTNSP